MPHRGSLAALRSVNDDIDGRVLRELAKADASLAEIADVLGARVSREGVKRCLDRLEKRGAIVRTFDKAKWHIVASERVTEPKPRPSLPVLLDPIQPGDAVDCVRVGANLTASQCATRYRLRGEDPCSLDAEGRFRRAGCPVGARVSVALDGKGHAA